MMKQGILRWKSVLTGPHDPLVELQATRNRICDWTLTTSALMSVPAVVASIARVPSLGWQWVMTLHILASIGLWFLVFFRLRIPYWFRAGFIVIVFAIVGLAGVVKFGLIAGSIPFLISSPLLATYLFGSRPGVILGMFLLSVLALIGFLTLRGEIVHDFDIVTHAHLPQSWVLLVMACLLALAVPIAAATMTEGDLRTALEQSRKNEQDLEQQVHKRTQELAEAMQIAEHMARTDPLTGVHNRRGFFEYARFIHEQSERFQRAYVILMIDIDHFKSINDTWGHAAGDEVLKMIGQIMLDSFRKTDIPGRLGGEEFAVLLPETQIEQAKQLAEKLRQSVQFSSTEIAGTVISFTISTGIASSLSDLDDPEKVVARADTALYLAKNKGRNRVEVH